ncbi:fimbrial protein [Escherichia coli]|uniref:fimbrial protein n=1 Tax=Escherichia coli TaxID=562 RepID=UPI003B5AAEB4
MIGLCIPDIGWLVCRFAVCRIFPALKSQAGKPRANEHPLFPSTLQNDCDTNVSSNAAVAFLGTTVTSNDDTLALQSSAAGSAQNVGIQILDRTGEVLILDGATFSAKTDLIDGTNILPFQARYIALGQSVAGTANADATFKVQYL